MTVPFFSLITISYNQAAFLVKCLDSVSSQGLNDYEHIVVDPGSVDGSRAIVETYPSNHVVPVFEKDSGPPDGLNNGVKRAVGEYILFLNSDDYLLDDALNLVYSRLKEACFPGVMFLGGYIKTLETGSLRRIYPGSCLGNIHALGLSSFFQQGTVIKAELVRESGAFNANNRTCWDGELFLKLLADPRTRAKRYKDPVAVFVIHGESITGSGQNKAQYLRDSTSACQRYYNSSTVFLRHVISASPREFRFLFKYILDPRLAFWRSLQLIQSWFLQ